jgi:mycothiol synthase
MPLRIRPISVADYQDIARLSELIDPGAARTEGELREADRRRDARMKHGGMVAEGDGERGALPVAFGIYTQYPDVYEPDKVVLKGGVHPQYRRRAVGSTLLRALEEHLSADGVRGLRVMVGEDDGVTRAFLERQEFRVTWRRIEARLRIRDAVIPDVRALASALANAGVRVVTYAESAQDPSRDAKLHELSWRLEQDIPYGIAPTPLPLDTFLRERIEPNYVLHDALFIATDGNDYVGLSSLWEGGGGRYLEADLTGVLPAYRGRGIATLLKVKGIAFARDRGYDEIRVVNDEQNEAMRRINQRLGFVPRPALLRLEKALPPHAGK